jgi:hypothetical protein
MYTHGRGLPMKGNKKATTAVVYISAVIKMKKKRVNGRDELNNEGLKLFIK